MASEIEETQGKAAARVKPKPEGTRFNWDDETMTPEERKACQWEMLKLPAYHPDFDVRQRPDETWTSAPILGCGSG